MAGQDRFASSCIRCSKSFDLPICDRILAILKANSGERDAIRLSVITGENRGAEWLNALPIRTCGLLLNDEELRINVGLRLGSNIVSRHKCRFCNAEVSPSGTHGLSCRFAQGRFSRHAECNDLILRAMQSAGIPASREPNGIFRNDGKRPDGVTRIPWSRGLCLAWDFTCVDCLAPSRIDKLSHAASDAEKRKSAKYSELTATHHFSAVACCTLASWGGLSLKFLKALGKKLADNTLEPRAGFFLRQRLSVAIARGNATSVLGTIGDKQQFCLPLCIC